MKKILFDTNVVLDLALQRIEFGEKAKELIKMVLKKKIEVFVTSSSITDIYYVLRKAKGHNEAIEFLRSFFKIVNIVGVDSETILDALYSGMKDFEDAVQTEAEIQNNINIIITRDKKDFKSSGLEIFSPDEYINEMKNNN
ncbi:MAG: hypothetical protein B6I24_09925 [Bacteroidetes bacterium 4572_128]|nr:MAG: hypothetical protein B6I24_09925 [Bacteroidetes bacterium 4572_128]